MEFSDITDQFHAKDFLVPDLLASMPLPVSSIPLADDSAIMDATEQSPIDIYGESILL